MREEERFQEIKWLLNTTIEEFNSFLKSAGEFEDVKVGNGWEPSNVPYFPYMFVPIHASQALQIAENKKVEIFRSIFWIIGPKHDSIEMIGEPSIDFVLKWEIEGYHECFFFRTGSYHMNVKNDVVAIEVEEKLRNLVTTSPRNEKPMLNGDEKIDASMVGRPKYFTIDDVVELAYQYQKGRLYLDETGFEDKELETILKNQGKIKSLTERSDLDNILKEYLAKAVESKSIIFDKLKEKIVRPPNNFSKILSNRFQVTRLNLFLIPLYVYKYRYKGQIKQLVINGITGESEFHNR